MSALQKPIDVWIQHPTPSFVAHPMFRHIWRWLGVTEIPQDIPFEFTHTAIENAGVGCALLSAWHGPDGVLLSNDDVARFVAAHPGQYRGVASVNIANPVQAVRELRRCVRELGFVGLRTLPWWWEKPPSDALYYPLYVACVEENIPLCLQVGHTGPDKPSEMGRPIPYLERVALDFPDLKIVAGHIGDPWTREMIFLATKFPNVYIDTSAYKPSRYPQELVQFMKKHGRKKVMFGSNFPMIQPAQALAELEAFELSEEVRRLFLWENAQRVFRL